MAPRYIPLSTLLWVAVVVMAALAMPTGPLLRRTRRQLAATGGLILLLGGIAFFSLANSQFAVPLIVGHYRQISGAPEALRRGDESYLSRLGPFRPEETREWREFLKQHRLSVWRETSGSEALP
jgi:hypothetical protein